jgi:hypothetical protein
VGTAASAVRRAQPGSRDAPRLLWITFALEKKNPELRSVPKETDL